MALFPPHLPPPSSSISQHQAMLRAKLVLLAVVFGLLSGLSGAAIMLVWFWPHSGANNPGTFIFRSPPSVSQLSDKVIGELTQKTVAVYSKASEEGGAQFFDARDIVGQAVVLVNEGWVVLYAPGVSPAQARNWRALTSGGLVLGVERALPDTNAGFLYLKLSGAPREGINAVIPNLPLVPILFARAPLRGSDAYISAGGVYRPAAVLHIRSPLFEAPRPDSAPAFGFRLSNDFAKGSWVFTGEGTLLGVIISGNTVMPASAIDRVWPSIIGSGAPDYPSLGVVGFLSSERPLIAKARRQDGFAVMSARGGSGLRRGDIILSVDGENAETLDWRGALENEKEVTVSLMRAGKTIELVVPVVRL